MIEPVSFDPRVVSSSRKEHKCYVCAYNMPKGTMYVAYPFKGEDGKFKSLKICVECGYLMRFKTGDHKDIVREGEFTERRIPNFLKKKRSEFRKNPLKAIRESFINRPSRAQEDAPRIVSRLVVKASEFDRHIHNVPSGKYSIESFPAGGSITICAGVSGDKRIAIIKRAWEVDGAGFGLMGKRIAILLEAQGK